MSGPAVVRFTLSHPPGSGGRAICPAGDVAGLIADLRGRYGERLVEFFEERAAIREYDAGHPRQEAEAIALQETLARIERGQRPTQDRIKTEPTTQPTRKDNEMSLTLSASNAVTFQPAPAGTWLARCFRVIDLGMQPTEYQGKTTMKPKLMLSWELLDDETKRDDGGPMTIHKRYTASLSEKSRLRPDLESWRGKAFTPEELQAFEVRKLAGAYCLLGVVHSEKNGTTYANVSSIIKPPKGMALPSGVNDVLIFDIADPATYDNLLALPDKLREQITASPSWEALKQPAPSAAQGDGGLADMDDDICF